MLSLASDLRQAARSLAHRPGFLAVAVLTLALGIGANSALFSMVNAVLLRPLPYQDAERLVWIEHEVPSFGARVVLGADFLDWREGSRTLSRIAAFDDGASVTVTGRGEAERLAGARVSSDFLAMLGVRPEEGRDFRPDEERPAAADTTIVSRRLWDRLFGGRPFGGEPAITLDGHSFTVVGVLPRDFRFPGKPEVDVLVPLSLDLAVERGRQNMSLVEVIGRLAPGATLGAARAELDAIHQRGEAAAVHAPATPPAQPAGPSPRSATRIFNRPGGGGGLPEMILSVVPLRDRIVGDTRTALLVLLGAVALVLLIACANVANLLLARATARHREIAVRAALGASRSRIARHLLTESALLGLLGGGCGLVLAAFGVRLLLASVPPDLAGGVFHQIPMGIDGTVLLFTLALSLATGLLFGLAPMVAAWRPDLQAPLKEGGTRGRSSVAGRLLVAAEVALAAVLLTGAGLLLRSFLRVSAVEPGFRAERTLTAALELDPSRYATPVSQAAFAQELTERVRSLPGVAAAGFGDAVPLTGFHMKVGGPRPEGRPDFDPPGVAMVVATPGYFESLGIPLVRGRSFAATDSATGPKVAIVSETLARLVWAGQDPVGQRFQRGSEKDWITVVGVAADSRFEGLEQETRPVLYRPFAQQPIPLGYLTVRTVTGDMDPLSLVATVRREARALDAGVPLYDVSTMEQRLAHSVAERRFSLTLLGLFSILAVVLAGVGLYGVLAYLVAERTWEIGVRMALGAERRRVLGLVIGQGLWPAVLGVAAGLAAALALSRVLASAVFGITTTDPLTYAAIPTVLLLVALAASYLPARRATRVDPIAALRAE